MTRIASPVRTRASQTQILVNNYFDSVQAEFVQGNHVITVENGLILSVLKESEVPYRKRAPENPDVIDLRGTTVLPGFVDTHVHMFLHPYEEASWSNQLTRESLPERTIRGVKHARDTLLAGFTTVRDLGTEGASDADFALRKCISSPLSLVPGPRYFCSSRAIVTTGSYGPKLELYPGREGVDGVTGAQAADGPDECMKAVRQQVGAGADWIKVYSGKIRLTHTPILFPTKLSPLDYSHQYRISQTSPTAGARPIPLWTKPEWDSLVSTAHSLGVKVASHANTPTGALAALEAGASTLEHGYDYNQEVFDKLRETRAFWNPTLSVFSLEPDSPKWPKLKQAVQAALKENEQVGWNKDRIIRITCGGDTGPFAHGTNALELQLLHSLGMPARRVLQAATHLGWECVRGMVWDSAAGAIRLKAYLEDPTPLGDNEVPFGSIEPGFAADLIATTGDLVGNNEQGFAEAVSADKIVFVMKAGKMYKSGGEPVL